MVNVTVSRDFTHKFFHARDEECHDFTAGDSVTVLAKVISNACKSGEGYVVVYRHPEHGYRSLVADSTLIRFHPELPVFD